MAEINELERATMLGTVTGPYQPELLVCQKVGHLITSRGFWYSDPFSSALPVLLFQIILIFFTTRILVFFLKPLRVNLLMGYILAGIIIGPTVLGRNGAYFAKVFPPGSISVLMTLADVGFMIHVFTIGLQVNIDMLTKTGKSAAFIGSMCFLLPYALGFLTFSMLNSFGNLDASLKHSMPFIIIVNSLSTFPVITSLLVDLRILNSEVGRMATQVSLVSDMWSWNMSMVVGTVNLAFQSSKMETLWSVVFTMAFLLVIAFVIRPFLRWSTKSAEEGEMKEMQFCGIMVSLLCCGLLSEILGQHSGFGAFLMGLVLPDGPGTTLVQKLEAISSVLLVPAFMASTGLRMTPEGMGGTSSVFTELIIIMGYVGKFCGTLLSAICCGLPLWDAIPLSLIMCCKGIIELAIYVLWLDRKIIPNQVYNQLLLTMLIVTTLARPIIAYMYDPSRRYLVQGRKNLHEWKEGVKMQFLVCLHDEDHVPTIMNLLEASHPTPHSPIAVFVLHLRELQGRSASMLAPHRHQLHKSASKATSYDHIVNVFQYYEEHNCGSVVVQHFTAVSPYASIHNDICMLASDKRTNLVIVPFHKTWAIDGSMGTTKHAIRNVNKNVMNKVPCSVGILIDRGHMTSNQYMLTSESAPFRIVMLFLGGADDREALAYCMRMVEHPKVDLTIAWVKNDEYLNGEESGLDQELMDIFRAAVGERRVRYIEETVADGVGTTQVIRSFEDKVDMLIAGKHHDPLSPLISGLTEWNEYPELGVIGDMLATSDFQFSVLVVQREPVGSGPLGLFSGSQSYSRPWRNSLRKLNTDIGPKLPEYPA
ncbi:cation/H(+) antiporter 14-like [Rhodamnia argentea]|uniref:Cation/H(+) antiporter 14-like n=1 Tax=Rhodamnia argentea TaxID=178133 RepID=A0ABM3HTG4_9MYRT|nr:cation/H(+) antiporter 14-like [Rhodamnia argentea]